MIHTTWRSASSRYDPEDHVTDVELLHNTLTLHPSDDGQLVTLRVDLYWCEYPGRDVVLDPSMGQCILRDRIGSVTQSRLNTLGANLQSTLRTGMVVVATE